MDHPRHTRRMSATTGRPPTPIEDKRATFAAFIDAVEDGKSIREACETADISWRGVARWMADDANTTEDGTTFGARYARARSFSAEAFADQALTTALDARETTEGVALARLKVDVLKWRAAMADPKWRERGSDVNVNVNLGALHLDALRKVDASARIAHDTPKSLPRIEIEDATPEEPGTE